MDENRDELDNAELRKRLSKIKIIRPLEIGYERLPDGVNVHDFIERMPVRSVKGQRYARGQEPRHPLFSEAAVVSRDVMELEFRPHSDFYRRVVEKKYGRGAGKTPTKTQEEEYIPWHLVDEPEHVSVYREYRRTEPRGSLPREASSPTDDAGQLITGLDKLLQKIDWLKFYDIDDNETDSSDE